MDTPSTVDPLFLDETILAVNKPAGILSIRDGYNPDRPNLHQILANRFGRLWVVHRLDAETSGVMLFARSASAHRHLSIQFEQHLVRKAYHLLAIGPILWKEQIVSLPLLTNGDRRHRTIIDLAQGKPASTAFRLLESFSDQFSLLSAAPTTGYTHQIRAHCAAIGLWLVNDPLYLPHPFPPPPDSQTPRLHELLKLVEDLPITRLALHAVSISFSHPATEKPVAFSAPIPPDFESSLQYLRVEKNKSPG